MACLSLSFHEEFTLGVKYLTLEDFFLSAHSTLLPLMSVGTVDRFSVCSGPPGQWLMGCSRFLVVSRTSSSHSPFSHTCTENSKKISRCFLIFSCLLFGSYYSCVQKLWTVPVWSFGNNCSLQKNWCDRSVLQFLHDHLYFGISENEC